MLPSLISRLDKKELPLNLHKKLHFPNWVLLALLVTFLLRIPSFFEPYWYGDEAIYLTLGDAFKKGLILYKDIHDNKPPLIYLIAALSGSVFWFRVILTFWHLVTVAFFWHLSRILFKENAKAQKVALWFFVIVTSIPFLEGTIANSEIFMMGPTIIAFYLLLSRRNTLKVLLGSGLILSLSALFKVPAVFDIPAIVVFFLITPFKEKSWFPYIVKKTFLLMLGFAIPLLIVSAWLYYLGAFSYFLKATLSQNINYLSTWGAVKPSFLGQNGPLLIRGSLVLLFSSIFFFLRRRLDKTFIFASLWLIFSLFGATLSGRPYPHYLIQTIPAASLLVGILVGYKKIEQVLTLLPLSLLIMGAVYFKFYYYEVFSYYNNFASFIGGRVTKDEYLGYFGKEVPSIYETAKLIDSATEEKDKIFVWGDRPEIYALSKRLPAGRYTAAYHIMSFGSPGETIDSIMEEKPKAIVVPTDSKAFPELNKIVKSQYYKVANYRNFDIYLILRNRKNIE